MRPKSDGVRSYTHAVVDIYFTEGEERCKYCPMLHISHDREYCHRTGELVTDIWGRGLYCPLKFDNKEEKHE